MRWYLAVTLLIVVPINTGNIGFFDKIKKGFKKKVVEPTEKKVIKPAVKGVKSGVQAVEREVIER